MTSPKFCTECGAKLNEGSFTCSQCGAKSGTSSVVSLPISEKSGLTAFLLCLFLGGLGIHRFYVGKIGTGILMLLTSGGLGIWYLIDLINIVCNNFTDKNGNHLEIARSPSSAKKALMVTGAILAGFFMFFGSILTLAMLMTSSIVNVAQHELTAIRSGNIEKAYSLTSIDFQKSTSLEQFRHFIESHPAIREDESASFGSRRVKNNEGDLRGTLYFKDGSSAPIEFRLVYENDAWKILSIDLNPGPEVNE